jgi:hypothetical protein
MIPISGFCNSRGPFFCISHFCSKLLYVMVRLLHVQGVFMARSSVDILQLADFGGCRHGTLQEAQECQQ